MTMSDCEGEDSLPFGLGPGFFRCCFEAAEGGVAVVGSGGADMAAVVVLVVVAMEETESGSDVLLLLLLLLREFGERVGIAKRMRYVISRVTVGSGGWCR